MQYFSEAVLHCSWLNRLFPAGHHIDLTVILKPSEQRKQAIRDRNCSFRTFAFRLSDDELGLFGSCSALHTLNGLADGQKSRYFSSLSCCFLFITAISGLFFLGRTIPSSTLRILYSRLA